MISLLHNYMDPTLGMISLLHSYTETILGIISVLQSYTDPTLGMISLLLITVVFTSMSGHYRLTLLCLANMAIRIMIEIDQ